MKTIRLGVLLLCFCSAVPAAASPILTGDTVSCAMTGPFTCSPTSAVVGAGLEFILLFNVNNADAFHVDLGASSVTITASDTAFLNSGELLTLSNLFGPLDHITGFTFSTAGTTGMTASDVAFSPHTLAVDMSGGTNWVRGGSVVVNLQAETIPTSTVPEPASMFLLGTGLVGVATRLRRRR